MQGLEVLLAVDKTVLVVTMAGVEDQHLTAGACPHLPLSSLLPPASSFHLAFSPAGIQDSPGGGDGWR